MSAIYNSKNRGGENMISVKVAKEKKKKEPEKKEEKSEKKNIERPVDYH